MGFMGLLMASYGGFLGIRSRLSQLIIQVTTMSVLVVGPSFLTIGIRTLWGHVCSGYVLI